MPKLTVMNLRPHSAFLLGRRGVGQEVTGCHVPSDTLFAALMAAWLEQGWRAEDWMAGFPTSNGQGGQSGGIPPFLLTSAFPFAGDVRFYPRPLVHLNVGEHGKEVRQVRFVSEGLFRRILAGESLMDWVPPSERQDEPERGVALQGGALWLTCDEVDKLPPDMCWLNAAKGRKRPRRALREMAVYDVGRVPRVTVDRIRHASEIYHTGRLTFASDCGMWFGVQWNRPDDILAESSKSYREMFFDILAMLGDGGLGGGRSSGYGAFRAGENGHLDFADPARDGPFVTLSRYHPKESELPGAMTGERAAYDLEAVGGWLQSAGLAAQRRRQVRMVSEGSVCYATGPGPWGDVVDVRPVYEGLETQTGGEDVHPVWRYGLACAVALGGDA